MVEHELLADRGVLVVRPQGKLTKEDFAGITGEADAYIEEHGGLDGLMIVLGAFPGWENFEGFAAHLRFVKDHHRKIRRVAVVSDGVVASIGPKIAKHFVAAEIRSFPSDAREEALEWLADRARPE